MEELVAKLTAENVALKAEVARLTKLLEELKAKLGMNSSNSSKPSSTDAPWNPGKRRPPSKPSGKRRGAQPGHKPSNRIGREPDAVWDVYAGKCGGCGAALDAASAVRDAAWVHQLVELVASTEVRDYHMHVHQCACGHRTRAKLPHGVPPTASGPRLQAAITTLVAKFGLSRQDVQQALDEIFDVQLSVGAIQGVTDRAAEATRPAVQDIGQQLQAAPVKHCDETGWRHGGQRAWVWVVTSAMGAFFRIDPNRSRQAFRRLLPQLQGLIHTDRWRVYDIIEQALRQLCHAHLRRDIQALIDLGKATEAIGKALLAASDDMFHLWHRYRAGECDLATLKADMVPVQDRWKALATEASKHDHKKARALGRDLLKQWVSLWAFLDHPGADPTNNRAERDVRPAVILRKTNGGTGSDLGAEFVANLQSVIVTARCQQKRVVDWLESVFVARCSDLPPPMLLPTPSG